MEYAGIRLKQAELVIKQASFLVNVIFIKTINRSKQP